MDLTTIVTRLLVMTFFLLFGIIIMVINVIKAKAYQKNEKLKNLPFNKPVWQLVFGLIVLAFFTYIFIRPIIIELGVK